MGVHRRSWRRCTCGLGRSADRPEKRLIHFGAPPATTGVHLGERLGPRPGRTVAARAHQCVIYVDDADDLRGQGNLVAAQAVGISAAVDLLVMPPDDRLDVPREIDRAE